MRNSYKDLAKVAQEQLSICNYNNISRERNCSDGQTLLKSLFPANFDQVLTLLYFCMRATINHGNTSTVANTAINKNTFAVSLISSKPSITSTYKTSRNICTCCVFWACSIQRALIYIYTEKLKEINLWCFLIAQSRLALSNKWRYCNLVSFIFN